MVGISLLSTTLPTETRAETAPALPGARLADELSQAFEQVAETITPSVVTISTETKPKKGGPKGTEQLRDFLGEDFFDKMVPSPQRGLGTGVIVDDQGHILTNNHVIGDADEVTVRLGTEKSVKAKVVGVDPRTDLAVIKIDLPNIPAIVFGKPESARVGDVVLAIGNPYGVGQTVTLGIVSALGRSQLGISTFENFIQTDAAINPGNSGGALVDANGHLLGINTAIYSRTGASAGIGFAIPANMARQVMDQIISSGAVTRGFIGIEPQEITADLAESFKLPRNQGVLVAGVIRNGPADRAGVKPGDVLVEVEGTPVRDPSQMLNLIAQLTPGSNGRLKVMRKGEAVDMTVTVGKRPRPQRSGRDAQE